MRAPARLSRFKVIALFLATLSLSSCERFPDIQLGSCGNNIVEPALGEDCDGYAPDGNFCRPSSASAGQCRFDCASSHLCPEGYACGVDKICRQGSGKYKLWGNEVSGIATQLTTGDFDGDQRDELLTLGNPNPLWRALPKIFFFDDNGMSRDVFEPKFPISSPSVTFLGKPSDTPHQSLVFATDHGIASLSASSARAILPAPYPFQALAEKIIYRVIPIKGASSSPLNVGIMGLLGTSTSTLLFGANSGTSIATLNKPVSSILSAFGSFDFDQRVTSPCTEFLFAYEDEPGAYRIDPCSSSGDWRILAQTPLRSAAVPDDKTVTQSPLAMHVNDDDYLDLLLSGSDGVIYVAFGLGDGRFAADLSHVDETLGASIPLSIDSSGCPDNHYFQGFPLAAGDLNGDDVSDLVAPNGVFLVAPEGLQHTGDAATLKACQANSPFVGKWALAHLDDFNRDGRLDLVASATNEPDVDFLLGTGQARMNPFTITTDGAVKHFASGDLDGDLTPDLAFATRSHGAESMNRATSLNDTVYIAFGSISGAPEQITQIGRFHNVHQLGAADYATFDAIEELGVVSQRNDAGGDELAVFIGNPGQQPIAPMGLSLLTGTGDAYFGLPLTAATGRFDGAEFESVIALASTDDPSKEPRSYRLWRSSGAADSLLESPKASRLLTSDFHPLSSSNGLSAHLIAGDLSCKQGASTASCDKVDELSILSASADPLKIDLWSVATDDSHFSTSPDSDFSVTDALVVPPQSTNGSLLPNSNPTLVDLDLDGYLDLVFLANHVHGDSDTTNRVLVAWNDGHGNLRFPKDPLPLSPSADPPLGLVGKNFANGGRLFIVTASLTLEVPLRPENRNQLDGRVLKNVRGGQAITTGDLTGDGLLDIVVATPNSFVIYTEEEPVRQ